MYYYEFKAVCFKLKRVHQYHIYTYVCIVFSTKKETRGKGASQISKGLRHENRHIPMTSGQPPKICSPTNT